MRESNIPSESILELVLALSVPTMLPPTKASFVEDRMVRDDGAIVEPLMTPSAEVRIGAGVTIELEQSTAVPAIPLAEYSRACQALTSLWSQALNHRSGIGGRRQ